jgi:hypothetical protein
LPATLVQVEDALGLALEVRVAREDPATMLPRAYRILVQPSPDGAAADTRDQPRALRVQREIARTEARER